MSTETDIPTAEFAESNAAAAESSRYRTLGGLARIWLSIAAVGSVAASVYIIFGLGNVFDLPVPLETEYFYFMLALLLPLAFLIYPLTKAARQRVPWFDWLLALTALLICGYFAYRGNDILEIGWEYDAPEHAKYLAFVLWALVLEATRRAGGNAIFVICLVVSIYPIFSAYAPGFLEGPPVDPYTTAGFHVFGT
ncbi:MAG: hypothetical protein R3E87_26635, partial [Burkholderiaceae bacterium]